MVCAAFRDGVRPVDEVEATSVPVAGEDQTISGMAGRYATALFELALENKAVDAVKKDLDQFDALIADSADLNRLVRSPVFGADEQRIRLSGRGHAGERGGPPGDQAARPDRNAPSRRATRWDARAHQVPTNRPFHE